MRPFIPLGALAIALAAAPAHALTSFSVPLNLSFGEPAGSSALFDFSFGTAPSPDEFSLALTIKNTSAAPITAASLVSFAFDLPTGTTGWKYLKAPASDFEIATPTDIPPAGPFDLCYSTTNNRNNPCISGVVAEGLAIGEQETFNFVFSHTDTTVDDVTLKFRDLFASLQIDDGDVVNSSVVLAARIQGIAGGTAGSDKITGRPIVRPPDLRTDSVPGPLPALGLAGAFAWSRRLRQRINAA